MQKVLISGGCGFIGSHLIDKLLENGFEVYCVDNLITGDRKNIKEAEKNGRFNFLEHDVTKPIDFNNKLDYIFHLASPASPNENNKKSYINYPVETLLANSVGIYNLLELAKKYNAKFLYTSSSEVYGDPLVSVQKEDYFGNVNPIGVRSCYDEGKRFGEAMTMAYLRKHQTDVRIARVFNTYGPKMADDGRVVPNFIIAALSGNPLEIYGDGNQTRSFCFIDDMVSGIYKAMFGKNTKGEVFNLGNPDERKIIELAKLVKDMTKSKSSIVFKKLSEDDPKIRKPDISKAKKILGWTPRMSFEEGLKLTIDYFKNL